RVGPDFEVKGEIRFASATGTNVQAGIIMGLPDNMRSDWYSFRLLKSGSEGSFATFSRGWGNPHVTEHISLTDSWNEFRFKYGGGKADAWVNGSQVMRQAAPSKTMRILDNCLLGLGAPYDASKSVVSYRNVKVRRVGRGQENVFQE